MEATAGGLVLVSTPWIRNARSVSFRRYDGKTTVGHLSTAIYTIDGGTTYPIPEACEAERRAQPALYQLPVFLTLPLQRRVPMGRARIHSTDAKSGAAGRCSRSCAGVKAGSAKGQKGCMVRTPRSGTGKGRAGQRNAFLTVTLHPGCRRACERPTALLGVDVQINYSTGFTVMGSRLLV